jgi:hypothetical protein
LAIIYAVAHYNGAQIGDFEKLGTVLVAACAEIVHDLRAEEAKLESKL